MNDYIDIRSWIMAFTYPTVNIAIVILALYAARNHNFKREFYYLAIAVTLTFICAVITLGFRLYLAGSFSFLPLALRRGILLTQDFAEIASIVIYCIGFFKLALRIGSRPNLANSAEQGAAANP